MNTYIFSNDKKQSSIFAINSRSSSFEQRFWRSVAKLQDNNRWLCLISPKDLPNKRYLEAMGVNIKRLLIVHCNEQAASFKSTLKALQHGKCSAVLTWSDQLSNHQYSLIQEASQRGQSHSLFIKTESKQQGLSKVA